MATARLYVGNLAYEATEQDLLSLFAGVTTVVSVTVQHDAETGVPRGYAYVEVEHGDMLRTIQALDGRPLRGRPVRVSEAPPRPPRSGVWSPFRREDS